MSLRTSDERSVRRDEGRGGVAVLAVLLIVDLAYAFQQTAVIPAIPTVQHDLHAGAEWSSWLLSAYLMVATVATPALGRLADLHGRRTVLTWTLGIFLVGSVVAALAPSIAVLVISRALQGLGGAVFPLTLSLARRHLPEDRVTGGVSTLTAAFGGGSALGFVCGGVFAQYLSWRVVFVVGAVAIAVGTVLVVWRIPRSDEAAEGRLDVVGTVLLGAAAVALLLALTLGVRAGWTSRPVLALFAGSALAAGLWVREELHSEDPLVDLRLFRSRTVALVNAASVGLGWALFGTYLLLPRLVQTDPGTAGYGLAAAAALTGFLLVPSAVAQSCSAPVAGILARRRAPGPVLAGGLLLLAGGAVVLVFATTRWALVVAGAAILGAGAGAAIQASSAVATQAVDADVASGSTALNSTIRRFAGGLGSQVSIVLIQSSTGGRSAPPHGTFVLAFAVLAGLALLGAVAAALAPAGKPA